MKSILKTASAGVVGALIATGAAADGHAQAWDMPMAYAATNFHSEHGVVFADKVREYTEGAIDITVHAGGSLFGGGDIKRAVQTGQVPIGERFMSAHANEAPLLGWDNLPFIATSYEDNARLWEAARDVVNAQLAEQNLVALYTCPWPGQGFYFNKEVAPHVEDAWIDAGKRDDRDKQIGIVGYEIPFNRHFYEYEPPRDLAEIDADLDALSAEIMAMLREVHS